MSVNDLIEEGARLFNSNKFDEAITKLNQAWDEIEQKRKIYLPKLLSTTKSGSSLPNS